MRGIRHKKWFGIAISLTVFLFAANIAVHLSRIAEPMIPRDRFLAELAYYPSGKWLRAMSLGEGALLADLTWIRAVQYYGEHRIQDNEFDLLYHAFDVVTNFDPSHRNSYVFGGTSLAQEGKQFDKGVDLLKKGRRANPGAWIYPFELGFIHYVEKRDFATATLWFQEAARKKNCPEYVKRFAAFSAERAGNAEQAIELWKVVAEETENPILQKKAVRNVLKLSIGKPYEPDAHIWARSLLAS